MTATLTEPTTAPAWINWIRPWYPGGAAGDHIDIECPELAKQTSTPTEGSGWLDPSIGIICTVCIPAWDATCDTCDAAMSEDEDEDLSTEADAKRWIRDHKCYPQVRLIPPAKLGKATR